MKRTISIITTLLILALLAAMSAPALVKAATTIPTITITSVDAGKTVTIQTHDFPANDTFDVTMNFFGTLGIGGTKVTSVTSNASGSQSFTFDIPAAYAAERLVAIRLQSPTSGYYSFNWFVNQTAGVPTTGGGTTPTGTIPTISIVKVDAGKTVTIETQNYPANDSFDVLMNKIGTLGIGGTKVATVSSDKGGKLTFTFDIPAALKDEKQIAIRLQSPTSGYYSFNWFWNNTSTAGVPVTGKPAVIPTFAIQSVVKDSTVTIKTANFPASDSFDVLMGSYGTLGVNGTKVGTVSSDQGGALTFTFNIPDNLKGKDRIAIRLQSPTTGYYSFNWFWNSTAP